MSSITVNSTSVCTKVVAIISVCAKVVAGILSILMCSSCMVMHGESTHAYVLLPKSCFGLFRSCCIIVGTSGGPLYYIVVGISGGRCVGLELGSVSQ